jgi:hypothetical protein
MERDKASKERFIILELLTVKRIFFPDKENISKLRTWISVETSTREFKTKTKKNHILKPSMHSWLVSLLVQRVSERRLQAEKSPAAVRRSWRFERRHTMPTIYLLRNAKKREKSDRKSSLTIILSDTHGQRVSVCVCLAGHNRASKGMELGRAKKIMSLWACHMGLLPALFFFIPSPFCCPFFFS